MKKLLILTAILLISVWLGLQMQRDSGYVLVAYQHWSMEMSLWLALAGLLGLFTATSILLKLLGNFGKLGIIFKRWKKQQRTLVARRLTKRGLLALAEGKWQKAEKYLVRGVKHSDMPLINYLSAARAAQEQNLLLKRNDYLQEAFLINPEAQTAISLTQAQLQFECKQFEQALATLTSLLKQVPEHPYVYKLLKDVYIQLNDWDNLLTILPTLNKYNILNQQAFTELEVKAYATKLQSIKASELNELQAIWQQLPRHLRKNLGLIKIYLNLLLKFNEADEAVTLIQAVLKNEWDDELVQLYGLAKSNMPDKQLKLAESWLQQHTNNTELLLCLGRLCIYNQLWGKARSYLEASITQQANPEACIEFAKLLEQLGQKEEALNYYREGLLHKV